MIMTTFESLLPPVLVLVVGLVTRRIIFALMCGIVVASLLVNGFELMPNLLLISRVVLQNLANNKNLNIFVFLLLLGVIVTLIQATGGAFAYQRLAAAKVKTQRDAEVSSMVLSSTLFIDDYLSCLTTGSVIKPLTDLHKVARLKLAYLVDTMAAPMAILCPLSSWVAAITGFFRENGITDEITSSTVLIANPFMAYLNVLPYMFYSFLLIASTWFIVLRRISFGPMHKAEQLALKQDYSAINEVVDHNATPLDFFGPLILLLLTIPMVILYTGGWQLIGAGNHSFFHAFVNANISQALCVGAGVSLLASTTWFIAKRRIKLSAAYKVYHSGVALMLPAIAVLVYAWALGDLLRDQLHTGDHLAQLLSGSVNINLLPMLLFFIALFISFAIGSSWGTAAILFPIAVELVMSLTAAKPLSTIAQVPIILPVLGAILSGAIAGNHISPISDTTVMSSTSTQTNLIEHVNTQLPYALPIIVVTGGCFLGSAFMLKYGIVYATLVPVLCSLALLMLIFNQLNRAKK
jgi:tetracycline resistance efflux pump